VRRRAGGNRLTFTFTVFVVLKQTHYETAREAALKRARAGFCAERLKSLGVAFGEGGMLELPCLCWTFGLDSETLLPRLLPQEQTLSVTWQILVLDYLAAPVPPPVEQMLSFADFTQARAYARPFQGRVLHRLSATIGRRKSEFIAAAERCAGVRLEVRSGSSVRYRFRFFPRFELDVVRHEGDDDLLPACNVLFPDNMLSLFTMEDAIVAAERLVAGLRGKTPVE